MPPPPVPDLSNYYHLSPYYHSLCIWYIFADEARQKKHGVLVHCLAGISRSVTITVAYLMAEHELSLEAAYDFVRDCKPNISPNFNFLGQLQDFERSLRFVKKIARPKIRGTRILISAFKSDQKLSNNRTCLCNWAHWRSMENDPQGQNLQHLYTRQRKRNSSPRMWEMKHL